MTKKQICTEEHTLEYGECMSVHESRQLLAKVSDETRHRNRHTMEIKRIIGELDIIIDSNTKQV